MHIAANGNFYRVAKPTDEFWDYYKEHKNELKEAGYSVYKHEDYGFCVYDWSEKRKASAEEIEAYNKEKSEYDKKQFDASYNSFVIEVEERSSDEVQPCSSWAELRLEVDRLCDNPDVYWDECILLNKLPDFFWL